MVGVNKGVLASCPSLDLSGFADARLNLRVLGNPVYVLIPHKIVTVGRIAPGVPTLDRREGSTQFQFAAVEARAVARSQVGRVEPSNIARSSRGSCRPGD